MEQEHKDHTNATKMNSSITVFEIATARSISSNGHRSSRLRRGRQALLELFQADFNCGYVSSAFLPERMTMDPPANYPRPFRSAMPRRISGTHLEYAPRRQGAPEPGIGGQERNLAEVVQRFGDNRCAHMYSASPSSSTEPPLSWLAFCTAGSLAVQNVVGPQFIADRARSDTASTGRRCLQTSATRVQLLTIT